MEAELHNFQATVFSLCGSGTAPFQSSMSHTILYAEAKLRNFNISIFLVRGRNFKPKNISYVEAELQNFKSHNSLCAEDSYARIRSARERRAEGPCVKSILAVLFGKELFIRFSASAFRNLLSIYVFSYFPFGFEGRMWDLIVSVPDHCLSFYSQLCHFWRWPLLGLF